MFEEQLSLYLLIAPFIAILLAFVFEFVNGFHDTANAVTTVIYTNTLKPLQAVVLSGLSNFAGAVMSSGAVAFGIVALLPLDWVLQSGTDMNSMGLAMVYAVLLSAIIWNVGTWYFGIPASSSHTLIGAIIGVAITNSWHTTGTIISGVNWNKAGDIGLALLFSPLIGFTCAGLLIVISLRLIRDKRLYRSPEGDTPPPLWIRTMLILTCAGVSFAHGSNDGQKGMGLIMLILVAAMPFGFAINPDVPAETWATLAANAPQMTQLIERTGDENLVKANEELAKSLQGISSFRSLTRAARPILRNNAYRIEESIPKLLKTSKYDSVETMLLSQYRDDLRMLTCYIPVWVKILVAVAIGLGTLVGWKRVVVTVGEHIGKTHMTYAQGAAAGLVAIGTIGAADVFGLPVSTTHVLSSGIAGTMVANHSGLQMKTVRNILTAWALTLPICIFLGTALSAAALHLLLLL